VSGNELLPAQVAEVMYNYDRPIWTATQMEAELDTDHKTETVRNKLNKLDEIDIINSAQANNGRIYWWDDSRSEWPIPPDVIIDGQKELTVSELIGPWYAKVGLLGLIGPTVAGVPLLLGIFQIAGTVQLPISGSILLTLGLSIILFSYVTLVYSSLLGLIQRITGESINMALLGSSRD
jgi:hypothetical protein